MVLLMDNMQELQISYSVCYNDEIAEMCIYGREFVKELLGLMDRQDLCEKQIEYPMTLKKLEGYQKLAEKREFYQENPVRFLKDFFNIVLTDSQAYLFQSAWICPQVLIVASRAYGKSFWISLFAMSKQMLSSNPWNCYIASGSGQQSAITFKKLEDIANDRITSLLNSSGYIFKNEVVVASASGDGFSHNPSGFEYKLFNGSFTRTLNSNVDKNRGARADCVIFDECGFLSADLIQVYRAFCLTDKGFATGVDQDGNIIDWVRLMTMPKSVPNQLIYVSSASSVDTEFYSMYRDFSKQMMLGNRDYFVALIDCELVMRQTIMNVPTAPSLTREKIDSAMRANPEKARREYYCEFTTEAGANSIIKRGAITRNEKVYRPVLTNDTGNRNIIIAYDPARSRDNSVITVGEIYYKTYLNGKTEAKLRILRCINLVDIELKNKTPMQTPEQVQFLKELIIEYNKGGDDTYSNIYGIYIDAGSGGAGVNIADYLMEDFTDQKGEIHRGLIDKEYSSEYVRKFPNAVPKIHLMQPRKYKSIMYEAMIELVNQDKVEFTASYDNKGYLTIVDIDEEAVDKIRQKVTKDLGKKGASKEEIEAVISDKTAKLHSSNTRIEKLTWEEETALSSIDAMKEEVVNMVRIKRNGESDSFELSPEKKNTMHDDRSYTLAMLCYGLQCERRKHITERRKSTTEEKKLIDKLTIRKGKLPGAC